MSLSIRVRRKCDGETGVVKSGRGSTIGIEWVTVVFDNNLPVSKNANISHFDIISIDTGCNSVDFGEGESLINDNEKKVYECYGDEVSVISWESDYLGCIPVMNSNGIYCIVKKDSVTESSENKTITEEEL